MMPHTAKSKSAKVLFSNPRLPSAGRASPAGRRGRSPDKGGDDTSALAAQLVGEDAGRAAAEEVRHHAGNNQRHAQPAEQEHPDQPAHEGADESHHHGGGAKGEEYRAVNGRDGVRISFWLMPWNAGTRSPRISRTPLYTMATPSGELQAGQHREDQHAFGR